MSEKVEKIEKDEIKIIKKVDNSDLNLQSIDEEKLKEYKERAKEIDETNVMKIGADSQQYMTEAADNFLEKVRNSETGEIGKVLLSMKNEIKKVGGGVVSQNPIQKVLSRIPIIRNLIDNISKVYERYDKVSNSIEIIIDKLRDGKVNAIRDNEGLIQMRTKNEHIVDNINDDINVLKIRIKDAREDLANMNVNKDKYEALEIADQQDFINELEARMDDLRMTESVLKQNSNEIRVITQSNKEYIRQINNALTNAIPIWKQSVSIGVSVKRQADNIAFMKGVKEYTNEMIKKKAELIKENAIELANENSNPLIQTETLIDTHKTLMSTVTEIERIYEKSKNEKKISRKKMEELSKQLDETIMKSKAISSRRSDKNID